MFGINWCTKFCFTANMPEHSTLILRITKEERLNKYCDFLSRSYRSSVWRKVKNRADNTWKPLFYKSSSEPFGYRCLVKDDNANLGSAGIISKLDHSERVGFVVAVLMPSEKIRLCSNYPLTLTYITKTLTCPMPILDYVQGISETLKCFCALICKAHLCNSR